MKTWLLGTNGSSQIKEHVRAKEIITTHPGTNNTWFPVAAYKDRYNDSFELPKHDKLNIKEVAWRCPQIGKGAQGFHGTHHLPPLPPMNEVMADSLKRDPLGHRGH